MPGKMPMSFKSASPMTTKSLLSNDTQISIRKRIGPVYNSSPTPTCRGLSGVVADFLIINPLSTARSVGERVRVRGFKTN